VDTTEIKVYIEYGAYIGGAVYGFYYSHKHDFMGRSVRWLKSWFPQPPRGPIGLPKDVRIDDILAELRVETRADRAHIFMFHNGDYYDNASPIRRFSCIHEKLKVGVESSYDQYQGNLVSGFIDGLRVLMESPRATVRLSQDDLENCLYKSYMVTSAARVHICVKLMGMVKGVNRVIGFILLSYTSTRPADKCAFSALHIEGGFVDSKTQEWAPRDCEGVCDDCRFNLYKTRLEVELATKE
jgi:hypothetical protein